MAVTILWDEFAADLDTVVEHGVRLADSAEINAARDAYYQRTGTPVSDHPGFERRNAGFLEWFVFERPMDATGTLPVVRVEREDHDERVRKLAARIHNCGAVAATVTRVRGPRVMLETWVGERKITALAGLALGFERGAAVFGRIFEIDGEPALSRSAEILDPDLARALRPAIAPRKSARDLADVWAEGLKFALFLLRYNKARPEELIARWVETNAVKS